MRSYLTGGKEESIGYATAVFTIDMLAGLRLLLTPQALATPVVFTERFTDVVFAACLGLQSGEQLIAVNARFKADREMVAHTLVEEFAHAQQRLDGVDFEAQRRQFAYRDRPYEQEAKRIATQTLGYEPGDYEIYRLRLEPWGILLDETVS